MDSAKSKGQRAYWARVDAYMSKHNCSRQEAREALKNGDLTGIQLEPHANTIVALATIRSAKELLKICGSLDEAIKILHELSN